MDDVLRYRVPSGPGQFTLAFLDGQRTEKHTVHTPLNCFICYTTVLLSGLLQVLPHGPGGELLWPCSPRVCRLFRPHTRSPLSPASVPSPSVLPGAAS